MGLASEISRPPLVRGTTAHTSLGDKFDMRPSDAILHANQALTLHNLPHRILD